MQYMSEERAAYYATAPERDVDDAIRQTAAAFGYLAFHVKDARKEIVNKRTGVSELVGDKDSKDFPDWLLVHPETGVALLIECKSEQGRVKKGQQAWLVAFSRVRRHIVGVVRPSTIDQLVDELKRRAVR